MLDIRYCAGFFDGEGSVYIHTLHIKNVAGVRVPYYNVVISVSNTNKDILDALKEKFGGGVYEVKRPARYVERHKRQFIWAARNKVAHLFLLKVLPYLRLKRRQAELAIQFRDLLGTKTNRDADAQLAIKKEIAKLNKRGPAA